MRSLACQAFAGSEHQEMKVFLLLFRKTKEESSFFEKKEAKKLLFLGRFGVRVIRPGRVGGGFPVRPGWFCGIPRRPPGR
jgi:hypothetical protein